MGLNLESNKTKKELQAEYKEREIVGGVYIIRNTFKNKVLLESTTDLQGIKNRFEFSKKVGSCVNMKLQKDWLEQDSSQFVLEVLEELEMVKTQTPKEFKADTDLLKEIWLEKLLNEDLY